MMKTAIVAGSVLVLLILFTPMVLRPAPSPTDEFWLNWCIHALGVVATFCAVGLALFGAHIRATFFPPALQMQLLLPRDGGDAARGFLSRSGPRSGASFPTRYYHVTVSNNRRGTSPATGVRVFLLRIEERGPGASVYKETWSTPVPMTWQDYCNDDVKEPARTIGTPCECDLCHVVADCHGNHLKLSPLFWPYTFIEVAYRTTRSDMIVTLQAKGIEADSPVCRIRIYWDGQWAEDADDMLQHLVIKQLAADEAT